MQLVGNLAPGGTQIYPNAKHRIFIQDYVQIGSIVLFAPYRLLMAKKRNVTLQGTAELAAICNQSGMTVERIQRLELLAW